MHVRSKRKGGKGSWALASTAVEVADGHAPDCLQ